MFVCVWTCNSFDYPFIRAAAGGKLDRMKLFGVYFPQFDMLQTTLSALCALLLIKKTQYQARTTTKKNSEIRSSLCNPIEWTNDLNGLSSCFSSLFSVIYHEHAYTFHVDGLSCRYNSRRFSMLQNLYARKLGTFYSWFDFVAKFKSDTHTNLFSHTSEKCIESMTKNEQKKKLSGERVEKKWRRAKTFQSMNKMLHALHCQLDRLLKSMPSYFFFHSHCGYQLYLCPHFADNKQIFDWILKLCCEFTEQREIELKFHLKQFCN